MTDQARAQLLRQFADLFREQAMAEPRDPAVPGLLVAANQLRDAARHTGRTIPAPRGIDIRERRTA